MKNTKPCCNDMQRLINTRDFIQNRAHDAYASEVDTMNKLIDNCPFCKALPKRILTNGGYFNLDDCAAIFAIDREQYKKYTAWRNSKKNFPKQETPRFVNFTFCNDGIGMGVEAECDGKRIDLTDYDNF